MAAGIIVLTTVIAGKSASISLKLQLPIMIAVGLSVVALLLRGADRGAHDAGDDPTLRALGAGGLLVRLRRLLPRGDGLHRRHRDERRSQGPQALDPQGHPAGGANGLVVYLAILGCSASAARSAVQSWRSSTPTHRRSGPRSRSSALWLVFPGMWGAILSSAFGSALGGPRVLQALAIDGLAPRLLGRTSKTGQPTIATWVTGRSPWPRWPWATSTPWVAGSRSSF